MWNKIILHNIIVIKETPKTFSLYNTWELFWQPWCYLEKFFYKKDITINQLREIIWELIKSKEYNSHFFKYINSEIKEFERPSDYIVKKLIDSAREKLGLKEETLKDRVDILWEIQEEINSFTASELSNVFDQLDLNSIEKNINVDIYIKQQIEDLKQLKWITTKLDKINELKKEEKLKEKKSLISSLKKFGKISLATSILVWYWMWSINLALARSESSSDSTSSSSYSSSDSSSDSDRESSREPSSSSSSRESSRDTSDSDSSSSVRVAPTPSRTRDTLSDKDETVWSYDVSINWSLQRTNYGTPSLQNLIIGLKAEETKKWDSNYTHYSQTTNYTYWQDFSTSSYNTFYINSSWWESISLKWDNIFDYDNVYVKLVDGNVYKLATTSSPSISTNYTDVEWTTENKEVTQLNISSKYTGLNLSLSWVSWVKVVENFETIKPNTVIKDSYSPYTNNILQNKLREHNHIYTSTWTVTTEGAQQVVLNINDDFIQFNINWTNNFKPNSVVYVTTSSWSYLIKPVSGTNTIHQRLTNLNIKESISENKYTISMNDVTSARYESNNWWVKTITETSDNVQIWSPTKTIEMNINEETNSLVVNWKALEKWENVLLQMKSWEVIQVSAISKMSEATKKMIYSILLWILWLIWAVALINFVWPIVLSVLGDTKVKLTDTMLEIANRIRKAREESWKANLLEDEEWKINKQEIENIAKEVLKEAQKQETISDEENK